MNWELLISFAALGVSILVAIYSYLQGRKSNNLQESVVILEKQRERQRQREANQATIIPRITTDNEWTGRVRYKLSIFNDGASEARNVSVLINEQTPTEYPHILTEEDTIDVIAPGNNFDFLIAKSNETESVWTVEVLWNDDFEEDRRTETTLSL